MEENEEKNIVNQDNASDMEVNNEKEKNTFTLAEVEEMKQKLKEEYETSFDEKFNKRWGHEMAKRDRDDRGKEELVNLLKSQTGKEDIEELLNLSYEQYGVERPKVSNSKDEEILGKYDAKEILDLDDEAIEEEANRLAGITNRTAREQAAFMELGNYLTSKKLEAKRKEEIREAGIDETILNNENFKDFVNKFNDKTSLKDIYEIYSKTNETSKKTKPFSAGSLKDKKTKTENEYFSEEEFDSLTREDLKDPIIYQKAMKTRAKLFNK